jgi:hypothetical protein
MEPCRGSNQIGSGLQGDAAGGLGVFEFLDRGEMAVGQGGIRQRPEMFGGLELGRIRRQKQQMDMLRHAQLDAGVPPRTVEDQDNLLGRSSADLAREGLQLDLEERDGHACRQVEDGTTRSRMDKADEVAPVVAVLDRRGGTLAVEAPDLLEDRLQTDAVFIDRPEFDARLGVRGRDCLDERSDLFLKASCSAGSASTCRGRGFRRLPSRRTR